MKTLATRICLRFSGQEAIRRPSVVRWAAAVTMLAAVLGGPNAVNAGALSGPTRVIDGDTIELDSWDFDVILEAG